MTAIASLVIKDLVYQAKVSSSPRPGLEDIKTGNYQSWLLQVYRRIEE